MIAVLTWNQFVNQQRKISKSLLEDPPTTISREGEENRKVHQPKHRYPITSEIVSAMGLILLCHNTPGVITIRNGLGESKILRQDVISPTSSFWTLWETLHLANGPSHLCITKEIWKAHIGLRDGKPCKTNYRPILGLPTCQPNYLLTHLLIYLLTKSVYPSSPSVCPSICPLNQHHSVHLIFLKSCIKLS